MPPLRSPVRRGGDVVYGIGDYSKPPWQPQMFLQNPPAGATKPHIRSERSGGKQSSLKRRDFESQVPWELASSSYISIRAGGAWKISCGSPSVTIAIIDEGFDIRKLPPSSEVKVLSASKCAAPSTRFSSAHGALLSELIAGNGQGYPGVAPKCRLLLIELPSFCTDAEEAYAFDLAFQFNAAAVCCA